MKQILVLCVIISLSGAAPTSDDAEAVILSYENDNDGNGNYKFSFDTSNGISRTESGRLVNVGQPDEHLEVQGVYSYTDVEGKIIIVHYTADENGYHIGDGTQPLIPLAPPTVQAVPPPALATLLG